MKLRSDEKTMKGIWWLVMTFKRPYFLLYITLLGLLILFTVFNPSEKKTENNFYYFNLMGESTSWELKNYKVEMTPETLMAGKGNLYFKNETKDLNIDFFEFSAFILVDKEEQVLQTKAVSGGINTAETISTGSIEGPALLNDGKLIDIESIKEIYTIVKWKDQDGKVFEEKITLYNGTK